MTIALDAEAALRAASDDVLEEIFVPPPRLTVSQWADANRILPSHSPKPGRWRTDFVPYLRDIMDSLGNDVIREVVFAKSAQVGGTSCGENWLAYLIDNDPCGILMLWPTEKKLRSWSRKMLKSLIEDTPCLAAKFPQSGRRETGQTISSREFPGGFLQLLTAKSTSDLRSTTARCGIVEETDEIDAEIKGQGDPIEQFDARFRNFWNSKQYKVSTPTIEGSRIWGEYEKSTQHRFHVPCPHCGHEQTLKWRDGTDDQDEAGAYRLIWQEDENGEVIPGATAYLCESCDEIIQEHHKMAMLLAGRWIATHPHRFVVGYHINTLYSPLCTWDDIARAFLKAKRSPEKMQTFVNLWLGLPYKEPGSKIDASFLKNRAETYGEGIVVPHGVGMLVAGVDVQGDRLEIAVWGIGEGDTLWLISWEELTGDPGQKEVWASLDANLLAPRKHVSGAEVRIEAACIDANYQTDSVHQFTTPRFNRNIIPTIGREGRGRKLIEPPKPDKYKRTARERHPAYTVGTDTGKDFLFGRLKLEPKPDGTLPPGYVHFPTSVEDVFYDQLTAERLVTKYRAGRPIRVWKQIEGRRNEALDTSIYALAAYRFLTMGTAPKVTPAILAERAKALSEWTPPPEEPERDDDAKPEEELDRWGRPKRSKFNDLRSRWRNGG